MNKERFEAVKQVYRGYGYTVEKDFPGEYYFMHNPQTGEKVRLYYSGNVYEFREPEAKKYEIKPLEWKVTEKDGAVILEWQADSPFGMYRVHRYKTDDGSYSPWVMLLEVSVTEDHDLTPKDKSVGITEALQMVKEDYEKRVVACFTEAK